VGAPVCTLKFIIWYVLDKVIDKTYTVTQSLPNNREIKLTALASGKMSLRYINRLANAKMTYVFPHFIVS